LAQGAISTARFFPRLPFFGIAKTLFFRCFRDFLNFSRRCYSNETPFFLIFEKAMSRFRGSYAVFWAELLPMVFFPQFAGGIACTGFVAENAKGFRRSLPISGY
jgi:hypothetical protein